MSEQLARVTLPSARDTLRTAEHSFPREFLRPRRVRTEYSFRGSECEIIGELRHGVHPSSAASGVPSSVPPSPAEGAMMAAKDADRALRDTEPSVDTQMFRQALAAKGPRGSVK